MEHRVSGDRRGEPHYTITARGLGQLRELAGTDRLSEGERRSLNDALAEIEQSRARARVVCGG